jgi:hypothetical protein
MAVNTAHEELTSAAMLYRMLDAGRRPQRRRCDCANLRAPDILGFVVSANLVEAALKMGMSTAPSGDAE